MKKMSAKNKVIVLALAWLILSFSMFFYFFGFMDVINQKTVESMSQKRKDLAVLKAERASFIQAKQDLQTLSQKPYQPENLFSKDISLVNEIRTLEDWQVKLGVKMDLSGISGTIGAAPKAKTITAIAVVPFGITLTGSLDQVVKYIQVLENLSFITNVTSVNIGVADKGNVRASLTANFYLKK